MSSLEQPGATTGRRVDEVAPQEWYAVPDLFHESTETTATPIPTRDRVPKATALSLPVTAPPQPRTERSAPTLTILSAYGEPETPGQFQKWQAAIVGLFFLVLLSGLGIGGWYWWSHRGSAAQTTPAADSNPGLSPAPSSTSPASTSTTPGQMITSRAADEEVTRLRERRIGGKPSESGEIVAAFEEAEKKYPTDYRFPYERAKLSIKGITTHHEAFGALSLATQKAIDNGKAQEMLESLVADKDGDFYKLSRGHHEWQALVQALSSKDKRDHPQAGRGAAQESATNHGRID